MDFGPFFDRSAKVNLYINVFMLVGVCFLCLWAWQPPPPVKYITVVMVMVVVVVVVMMIICPKNVYHVTPIGVL